MRVQFLEKIYHNSENPTLLTSLRRTRELFWIKELGTAKPYGFNDQIKGVGTLSSISCKKTNIYSLFNKQPRRQRSHGKRRYNKRAPQPDVTMSTLVDLVDMIEKPERCTQDQHQIVLHIISTASLSTRTCSGVNKL